MVIHVHQAAVHDEIEIAGRHVGDVSRHGEILEVMGSAARPHYRVRWDDGHESIFYPAGDTRLVASGAGPLRAIDAGPLVSVLRKADVEFELLAHRRTETARSEARALGVLPQATAKTLVARCELGCVRAVVSASSRLDLARLAGALGVGSVTLLTEPELVSAYPPFELGAVPPFAGPAGDTVVVDAELATCDYVVLEAGTHETSLRLRACDLVDVAGARVADIAAR